MGGEIHWRDTAPGLAVWAELAAPRNPSLAERNPAAFAWRDLLVDPDLVGLVPGRSRPTRIDIATEVSDPWRLPLTGVLATPLAWHPRLPLVAGLALRQHHAHPWVADYHARTVTLHEDVRAATALTDHGSGPVAWCGDRHLALLTPAATTEPGRAAAPGPAQDGPSSTAGPAVLEAVGPGFLSFLPDVGLLKEHAAARTSTLDVTDGSLVPRTESRLTYGFRLEASGDVLSVEYAEEERSEPDRVGLRRVRTGLQLSLAGTEFLAALAGAGQGGPGPLPRGSRRSREPRSHVIGTGQMNAHLTWEQGADDTAPVLLWLDAVDPGGAPATRPPESVIAAGRPSAVLSLPLYWPSDATVQLLHEQIVGTVRSALRLLNAQRCVRPVIVGGHSFGATLALYALAHVPELIAAVAYSGCYNRTLTPHGFQQEKRQYWEVPDIYQSFSAFHFADRLNRPVLLVHGAEDMNPATTPDQAVDLYRAIVAAGGHARLVLLPHEGHTFHYRETVAALATEHRDWHSRWDPHERAAS